MVLWWAVGTDAWCAAGRLIPERFRMGGGRAGGPFRGRCLLVSCLAVPGGVAAGRRGSAAGVLVVWGLGARGGGSADTLLASMQVCMLEGGMVLFHLYYLSCIDTL